MGLFDLSPMQIREFIDSLQTQADATRIKKYKEYEDFYHGGDRVKDYLDQHAKETKAAYQKRQERMADLNYTAALSDQLIDALYGQPVERRIEGDTAHEDEFQSVLDDNQINLHQRDAGWAMIVLGDAFSRIWYSEPDDMLRLSPVHPSNVLVKVNDHDTARTEVFIEKQTFTHRGFLYAPYSQWVIWSDGIVGTLRDDNSWAVDPEDSPYGEDIPYAHWRGRGRMGSYWGISGIRSVVTMQRMIHNRTSMLDRVILMQTHGQLVVLSEEKAEITSSEDGFLPLGPLEDAKYINPNAAIKEVQESIERLIDRLFEVGRVPVSAIKGGSANSGFQLTMEYVPMDRLVRAYKAEAMSAEYDLVDKVCLVGSAHGLPLPEEPQYTEVSFPDSFLPSDEKADFERDLSMLNNVPRLITLERFVRKWGPGDLDDKELEEYMAELDAEPEPEPEDEQDELFENLI